jgi:hypothetical protein
MSPNHARRHRGAAPIERAWAVVSRHSGSTSNLCGTVTMMPSQLRIAVVAAIQADRSAAATWAGTTIASAPRDRSISVTPAGDFTWAIGSPTM